MLGLLIVCVFLFGGLILAGIAGYFVEKSCKNVDETICSTNKKAS